MEFYFIERQTNMYKALNAVLVFLTLNIFLCVYAFMVVPKPVSYAYLLMVVASLLLLVGLLLATIKGDLDD